MKYTMPGTLFGFLLFAQMAIAAIVTGTARAESIEDTTSTDKNQQTTPITITPSRGQLLYENHCLACHESQVHIRQKVKATDFAKIAYFVATWSSELNVDWSNEEILAVTNYLNQRYYKYPAK